MLIFHLYRVGIFAFEFWKYPSFSCWNSSTGIVRSHVISEFLDLRASLLGSTKVITRKQTSSRNDLIKRAAGATWWSVRAGGPPGTLTQLIFTRCPARDGRPRSSRARARCLCCFMPVLVVPPLAGLSNGARSVPQSPRGCLDSRPGAREIPSEPARRFLVARCDVPHTCHPDEIVVLPSSGPHILLVSWLETRHVSYSAARTLNSIRNIYKFI